jgi:hypothetical protein|tara:strand:+ start:1767 stop:1958 length:192 start_codon:yes stop_codon:yes gene_type:complete
MVNRSSTGKQVTNPGKKKVRDVMEEYKLGKLKSSSGNKVTSNKQEIAIALSEARRRKPKRRIA